MPTREQIALWRTLDRTGKTITIEVSEQETLAKYRGKTLKACSGHPIKTLAAVHFWSLENDFRYAKRSGYFGKLQYEIEGYRQRSN